MPDRLNAPYCKIISPEWVEARYGVAAESILEEIKRADRLSCQVHAANDDKFCVSAA